MKQRLSSALTVVLISYALFFGAQASACVLQDFQVSTAPSLPEANMQFDLIIDYSGSFACISAEELLVSPGELRFEISCDCPFVTTIPVPQQFRTTVPGLSAGLYDFEAIHVDSNPIPRTVGATTLLIGHAPSIPISPFALTLLTLTLAAAAVWVLRRS